MPLSTAGPNIHNDGYHSGSAKRDTASGVAGLDAAGDILAKGPSLELTRDGSENISIIERTSGEEVIRLNRVGANDYTAALQVGASLVGILNAGNPTYKIGTLTRDTSVASGNQAISGVGFKPRAVVFIANIAGTAEVCIGYSDGTNHYVILNNHNQTANTWTHFETQAIWLMQTGAIFYTGVINSLDADGFTIAWTKTGAKTGTATINYIAFR